MWQYVPSFPLCVDGTDHFLLSLSSHLYVFLHFPSDHQSTSSCGWSLLYRRAVVFVLDHHFSGCVSLYCTIRLRSHQLRRAGTASVVPDIGLKRQKDGNALEKERVPVNAIYPVSTDVPPDMLEKQRQAVSRCLKYVLRSWQVKKSKCTVIVIIVQKKLRVKWGQRESRSPMSELYLKKGY